jgi:hypothetical protein
MAKITPIALFLFDFSGDSRPKVIWPFSSCMRRPIFHSYGWTGLDWVDWAGNPWFTFGIGPRMGRERQKYGGKNLERGHFSASIFLTVALSPGCFQLSRSDSSTFRENQKTYRRFSGTIFLEVFAPRLFFKRNGLQRKKSQKNEKTRKKV